MERIIIAFFIIGITTPCLAHGRSSIPLAANTVNSHNGPSIGGGDSVGRGSSSMGVGNATGVGEGYFSTGPGSPPGSGYDTAGVEVLTPPSLPSPVRRFEGGILQSSSLEKDRGPGRGNPDQERGPSELDTSIDRDSAQ